MEGTVGRRGNVREPVVSGSGKDRKVKERGGIEVTYLRG